MRPHTITVKRIPPKRRPPIREEKQPRGTKRAQCGTTKAKTKPKPRLFRRALVCLIALLVFVFFFVADTAAVLRLAWFVLTGGMWSGR